MVICQNAVVPWWQLRSFENGPTTPIDRGGRLYGDHDLKAHIHLFRLGKTRCFGSEELTLRL